MFTFLIVVLFADGAILCGLWECETNPCIPISKTNSTDSYCYYGDRGKKKDCVRKPIQTPEMN